MPGNARSNHLEKIAREQAGDRRQAPALVPRPRSACKLPAKRLQIAVIAPILSIRTDTRLAESTILSKKSVDDRSSKDIAAEKRLRAAADGKTAMAERAAREAFVEKNTVRLRELRLAKEAAEREALLANPPPAKAVKATKRSSKA